MVTCLPHALQPMHESLQELFVQEHGLNGDQFCNYVYRRYYFVKRLQNTMLLFLDIEDGINKNRYKPLQLDGLFDFASSLSFRDSRIKKSVDVMQRKRSLKPLFMIWEEFIGYKSIKDQIFVEEFTKEVFIISRNMLITLAAHDEFVVVPPVRTTCSAEQLLNDIDFMTEMINKIENQEPLFVSQAQENLRDVDLHAFAHIDDVMMRYYIIKRLKRACANMQTMPYKQSPESKDIVWHHPLIVSCKHVMEQSQSIDPLISLWNDVLQYKHVQDDLFMHEFVQLILVTHIDIFSHYAQKQPNKDPIATAITIYQVIDKLPLQEILEAIDIITHDLPPLLEKYEFDSDISWSAWFRKYWWAPPLIISTIGIHILINWETKKLLSEIQPPAQTSKPASLTTPPFLYDQGDEKWMLNFTMPF